MKKTSIPAQFGSIGSIAVSHQFLAKPETINICGLEFVAYAAVEIWCFQNPAELKAVELDVNGMKEMTIEVFQTRKRKKRSAASLKIRNPQSAI